MNGTWTNNWRALKNLYLLGNIEDGMDTLTSYSGSTLPDSLPNLLLRATTPMGAYSINASDGYNTFRFGSSTQTPSASDYHVISQVDVTKLSVSNEALTYDKANGIATKTVKCVVQNQTQSPVTLAEWGVLCTIYHYYATGGGGSTYTTDNVMVYRELFDSPVTLQPYESAVLNLTLTLTLNDPL